MQDTALKLLRSLPRYLREFGSVVSGPKLFIENKAVHTNRSFNDSIQFLLWSLAITVAARAPLLPPESDWRVFLGSQATLWLMSICLFVFVLRLSWRIVGGKAPFRSFFVTYAYFFGVSTVIYVFVLLVAEGVLKVFDRELYDAMRTAIINGTPKPKHEGSVLYISIALGLIGYTALSIWYMVAWGAYRRLNSLSKRRSAAAFIISAPFNLLAAAAVFFVANAIAQ